MNVLIFYIYVQLLVAKVVEGGQNQTKLKLSFFNLTTILYSITAGKSQKQ